MSSIQLNLNLNDDEQQTSTSYGQIATPKSPNSDGFSPLTGNELNDMSTNSNNNNDSSSSSNNHIKQKLMNEIDVEILLKHREMALISNEIEKVKRNIDILTDLHENNYHYSYDSNALSNSTSNDSPRVRKTSTEHEQRQHRTSYGGIRPMFDSQGNKVCVHKRSDHVLVQVSCPICSRADFGSIQGFLNHARLSHQIEYKSQDHAALMCGVTRPDNEQDEEGLKSVKSLRNLGLDVDKNLAPGYNVVDYNDDDVMSTRKRLKLRKNSEHLEKFYSNSINKDLSDFKKLIDDVTTTPEQLIDYLHTPVIDSELIEHSQDSQVKKLGHNRRKSRGGINMVQSSNASASAPATAQAAEDLPLYTDYTHNHDHSTVRFDQTVTSFTEQNYQSLTPSQRRRVPTIPNPLRTRSRSNGGSRESST